MLIDVDRHLVAIFKADNCQQAKQRHRDAVRCVRRLPRCGSGCCSGIGSSVPLLSSESAPPDARTTRWASMNIMRSRTCAAALCYTTIYKDHTALHGAQHQHSAVGSSMAMYLALPV